MIYKQESKRISKSEQSNTGRFVLWFDTIHLAFNGKLALLLLSWKCLVFALTMIAII